MDKTGMLIDPIYQKFSRSIIRTLGSSDFYEYFMENLSHAKNEFQFSNRCVEKYIDMSWIEAIEKALEAFENVVMNPRNIIREEEIIVNVAHAKKAGPDVVRHLAQHGAMVEHFDEETGDVRPSRLMQKIREDSTEFYENRLAYTVLEDAFRFVQIRHNALLAAMGQESGAKLKVTSELETSREEVHFDFYMYIKEKSSMLETDEKHGTALDRVSRIYRVLGTYMNSKFAESMSQYNRVRGKIVRTNVLKNNPNYRKLVELWEFMRNYEEVGYAVAITEQNPYINSRFERDIFHNIMFQYVILKGYLENEEQRFLPEPENTRIRQVRPKVIHEIIEELTENYDLPDIEIRKVLIEELTKEQLMLEEEAERRRLVEEAEKRRLEEEERQKQEAEKLRLEVLEEEKRLKEEKRNREMQEAAIYLRQESMDRKRSAVFTKELEFFQSKLSERRELRLDEEAKLMNAEPIRDFAMEAAKVEAEAQRKIQETERLQKKEQEMEEFRKKQEEKRQAKLQYDKDMSIVQVYLSEVDYFQKALAERLTERNSYEITQKLVEEQVKLESKQRQEQRKEKDSKQGFKWRIGIR